MQYLKTYLKTISSRGNEKLAESISHTAEDVGNRYIKSFSFCSHEIGLLFGNVQSGKTGQMFGIMCKAADLGFPAFVLLTTDNVVLQQQTLDRVKADLTGFCVCGENDSGLFIENSLLQPAIVVLKKNYRVLKLWANVFASTGFMKGNPLFIIDDEADAASLNTLVNRNKQSSINKYLDAIKNGASSSIYLQVTGTPQAILLQTMASGWRPYFTYYFEPGEAYLGGDFFFPKNKTSDCIKFLETVKKPEHQVVIRHLAVSSQILASGGKVSNCLVHPSVRQAVHGKYAKAMTDELLWCKEHLENEFRDELLKEYDHLHPQRKERVTFDSLFNEAKELLNSGSVKVLVMNGKNEVDSSEYSSGSNIVIGGNTLGRGVTFPALHTIYYTRTSKKPQADTMWQHSRMFGYDRDPGMMEVFIDEPLYKLFADINATNNSIIAQIEQGAEKIRIFYPEGLNPTRANVLDKKKVFMLSGGTNYYPFDPDNTTIEQLDALLAPFDDAEPSYQVNLRLMKEIFSHISSAEDFNVSSFVSILDTMLAEQPSAQGVLRVYLKTPNAPGQRAFLRCAASFFLEIRQYSCEKMSCATQKSLAAGHIMSFQIHPSIRRYVLPLLTSWKQKKSPGSIALQWIRAVRFHDSSLSDTYGLRSRFRHYVLTPPIPFRQIIHRKTEPLPLCQCCLQRVALADSQGAADFLGDHDAAEVVDAPDNACCFHKLLLQCLSFCAGFKAIVCIRRRNMQVRNTTGHANRSCFVYRNFVEIWRAAWAISRPSSSG